MSSDRKKSPRLTVYVAAPFARWRDARALHGELWKAGHEPVSHWVDAAAGATCGGDLAPADPALVDATLARAMCAQNDRDIDSADVLVALSYPHEGGEMFAEMRLALLLGRPVVYVGERLIASSFRPGVVRVTAPSDALIVLARIKQGYALLDDADDADAIAAALRSRVRLHRARPAAGPAAEAAVARRGAL